MGHQQLPGMVVLGSVNMDLVVVAPRYPRAGETVPGERFFTTPGGKGANQAVACARMGTRTFMVGRVGGDSLGLELLEELRARGVDVSGLLRDEEATSGVALIAVEPGGQNRIVVVPGANGRLTAEDAERAATLLVHADVLLLQLEVPPVVSLAAARHARALGKLVLFNPAPAVPFPDALYSFVDYLVPNEVEASALSGIPVEDVPSALRAARALLRGSVRGVVITLGAQGACYDSRDAEGHVPAFPVNVVDTVGAGDAFIGAMAVALAEGRPLPGAVRWGNAAGAIAVTRPGAQEAMPYRQEVEAFLGDRASS